MLEEQSMLKTPFSRALVFLFVVSFVGITTTDIFRGYINSRLGVSQNILIAANILLIVMAASLFFVLIRFVLRKKNDETSQSHSVIKTLDIGNINDPLLSLRFFACFCVLITHFSVPLHLARQVLNKIVAADLFGFLILGCAHSGMVVFFTLSGYLMGKAFYSSRYALNTKGILGFYRNRALRIFPLYYIASFIVIIFVTPQYLRPEYIFDLWRPLTFNYYGVGTGPIQAMWSLTTEVNYYVIAPFVFLLLAPLLQTRLRAYAAVLTTLTAGLLARYGLFLLGTDWYLHRYTPLFINLDLFITGFLFNSVFQFEKDRLISFGRWNRKLLPAVPIVICVFIFVFASFWEYSPYVTNVLLAGNHPKSIIGPVFAKELLPTIVTLFTGVSILFIEAHRKSSKEDDDPMIYKRSFASKISNSIQFLGLITYSIYVWHTPIMASLGENVYETTRLPLEYLGRVIVVFILLVIVSATSYFLIERPFERMKNF
jgi:peptidoglycan/LPS O-acetylase OafA/YrhL